MYLIIIDANVWIKFARTKNIAPLLDRLVSYQLLPVVNNYLLSEIFDALVGNKWMSKTQGGANDDKLSLTAFHCMFSLFKM